jgi:CheY-like chemotaxis protein
LVSRWNHKVSENSETSLQIYFDRDSRGDGTYATGLNTFDIDFQDHVGWGSRQDFVWGADYRRTSDAIGETLRIEFNPAKLSQELFSSFVQDEIAIKPDRLYLTLGTKLEHIDYTGLGWQPTARIAWTANERNMFWAAISRALRTPTQTDRSIRVNYLALPGPDGLPLLVSAFGNPHQQNEREDAYEAGYRTELGKWLSDSSTTRKYGGTGLGLTISTRLVEMMGGKIWVESEEGRGSQFHFTARLGATATTENKVGTVAPAEILRGVKVLVVDDNRTNRRILEGMLGRWEMRTTAVEGGKEALEQLSAARDAKEPYGLILTDMHMPKMDGFTLVENIRHRPELATATIMMLTSAGHRGDAARGLELGVSAYLLKPIRQSELREAIARVLGAREEEGAIPLVTRFSLHDARDPSAYLHVLLAEDNAVDQRLAVRLLEKRGHSVAVASNGREALVALEKEKFDLIFMDVQMPETDGLEATVAIREKEKSTGVHLPIIALTAHAMKGDREQCLTAGMDGYITKPIRPQELDEILEGYLARRSAPAKTEEIAGQRK